MDSKGRLGLLGAAVVLAAAGGFWFDGSGGESASTRAWFVNLETGEVFADRADRLAPFRNAAGQECVRGRFADCSGRRILLFYEKFNDETLEQALRVSDAQELADLMQTGWLLSRDGREWVVATGPEGAELVEAAERRARDACRGQLRISRPGD